jgi:8-oxo-dGTP pyrophosphatase MutT (NUDIX family)
LTAILPHCVSAADAQTESEEDAFERAAALWSGGTAEAAALREAQEEVGLDPGLVTLLGRMPPHETVTGYTVTPILAHIGSRFEPVAEQGEVDEVFRVPLAQLTDLDRYRVERRMWRGQWRRYYAVPWGPYYIWGATARMLHGLAERLA